MNKLLQKTVECRLEIGRQNYGSLSQSVEFKTSLKPETWVLAIAIKHNAVSAHRQVAADRDEAFWARYVFHQDCDGFIP
jgi:hypothetical protein